MVANEASIEHTDKIDAKGTGKVYRSGASLIPSLIPGLIQITVDRQVGRPI